MRSGCSPLPGAGEGLGDEVRIDCCPVSAAEEGLGDEVRSGCSALPGAGERLGNKVRSITPLSRVPERGWGIRCESITPLSGVPDRGGCGAMRLLPSPGCGSGVGGEGSSNGYRSPVHPPPTPRGQKARGDCRLNAGDLRIPDVKLSNVLRGSARPRPPVASPAECPGKQGEFLRTAARCVCLRFRSPTNTQG